MGKLLVAAARVLPLCAVLLVLPAIAASQPASLAHGWYRTSGPVIMVQDSSGGVIEWMHSYIYPYPGNDPLYWYAQVRYLNPGNQPLPITCAGRTDPSLAKEHMRGTPNAGPVAAEDTFCSRNPNFTGALAPGGAHYEWAIFHHVPWEGGEVVLEWGPFGVSSWVDPWYSPFSAPPPPDTYLGISAHYPTGSPAIGLDGLVAAYDMETVTPDGQLHDFSGQQNHGTLHQATLVPGLFGLARQFATTDDAVHLPENPTLALDGPLSLALWVRVDQLGLHQHLLACDDQFTLWITPDNHVRFTDTLGDGFETVDALATATWYSLVAVFHGTAGDVLTDDTIAVFLDGQPVDGRMFGRWRPGGLYAQDACYIGFESHQGEPAHQTLPFEGVIDELLIFSRALTWSEIAVHARP
jgi:hypothetical protein